MIILIVFLTLMIFLIFLFFFLFKFKISCSVNFQCMFTLAKCGVVSFFFLDKKFNTSCLLVSFFSS